MSGREIAKVHVVQNGQNVTYTADYVVASAGAINSAALLLRSANEKHPRGFFGPNVNPKTGVDFRGGKTNLYEGGVRVPAIAHWPGRIAAGRVSEHLCYFPDLMPTFAELAGTPPVKDTDGISFVPEVLGEKAAGRKQEQHAYLYWEITRHTAVRMGNTPVLTTVAMALAVSWKPLM